VGVLLIGTIVVSKIKPHIKENVTRLQVDLHLRCREAIHKPIERVVLSYPVIDELGVFGRDRGCAERLARSVVLQHCNLKQT